MGPMLSNLHRSWSVTATASLPDGSNAFDLKRNGCAAGLLVRKPGAWVLQLENGETRIARSASGIVRFLNTLA